MGGVGVGGEAGGGQVRVETLELLYKYQVDGGEVGPGRRRDRI